MLLDGKRALEDMGGKWGLLERKQSQSLFFGYEFRDAVLVKKRHGTNIPNQNPETLCGVGGRQHTEGGCRVFVFVFCFRKRSLHGQNENEQYSASVSINLTIIFSINPLIGN